MSKKQPLYPHVPKSREQPRGSQSEDTRQTAYTLQPVSIKRLYHKVSSEDLKEMLGHAEQLWSDTVSLVNYVERVIEKTLDPATKAELSKIAEELKEAQSFTFNLTEY